MPNTFHVNVPVNKPVYHGAKNDMFVSYIFIYMSDNNKTTPSGTFITTTTTTPVSEAEAKAEKKRNENEQKQMDRTEQVEQKL